MHDWTSPTKFKLQNFIIINIINIILLLKSVYMSKLTHYDSFPLDIFWWLKVINKYTSTVLFCWIRTASRGMG